MNFKLFLIISAMASVYAAPENEELKPFTTDLCTFFKEGTKKQPRLWAHCCVKHDLAYWVAGRRAMRKRADLELRACVKEVSTAKIANLMYRGVRLGHLSPIKSPYKWGWARSKKRGKYDMLTREEVSQTLVSLQYLKEIDPKSILEFIEFRFPRNNSF